MVTCYLDSQDYSSLTDPKTLTDDQNQIREALLSFAREGTVQFVFSAASVCEGVAVSAEATRLAERKAELLSDLCGTNALVSFDRLILAEVKALAKRCDPPRTMLASDGNWFPNIPAPTPGSSGTTWQTMRQRAEAELGGMGMSRQQRRANVRKLIKNGQPRGDFKRQIEEQSSRIFAEEIIKQYPMKLEYAEMMARYTLGRATEEEFSEGLMASLRDPRWMMKWFSINHALSSPVADIVRQPGRELGEYLRKLVDISTEWASILKANDLDCDPMGKHGEISRRWMESQDEQMINMIRRVANEQKIMLEDVQTEAIDKHCLGLSATIRSMYSSVWVNLTGARKEAPSNSQPVDALHAMYAPYVRVFRADRFMAPHIQKQVSRHGTIVVSRLAQLVEVLKIEIQQAG